MTYPGSLGTSAATVTASWLCDSIVMLNRSYSYVDSVRFPFKVNESDQRVLVQYVWKGVREWLCLCVYFVCKNERVVQATARGSLRARFGRIGAAAATA